MVWTQCTTNMVTKDDSFYLKLYQFVYKIINYKKRDETQITRRYREGNQVADFLVAFFILKTQLDTDVPKKQILVCLLYSNMDEQQPTDHRDKTSW